MRQHRSEENKWWGWHKSGWETRWKNLPAPEECPSEIVLLTCPLCGAKVNQLIKSSLNGVWVPVCENCVTGL